MSIFTRTPSGQDKTREKTQGNRKAAGMRFSHVLAETMEQQGGLVLRLSAYEQMMESHPERGGWTARWDEALQNRSRKIMNWMRTLRSARRGK